MEADTFTHPDPAYQILAEQGNEDAERSLNLVHTTASMLRDKAAINRVPDVTGEPSEDFDIDEFDGEERDDSLEEAAMKIGVEEGSTSLPPLPNWALEKESTPTIVTLSVIQQIRDIQRAQLATSNPSIKALLQAQLDSLQLYKLQSLRQEMNVQGLKKDVDDLKTFTDQKIDERMPTG